MASDDAALAAAALQSALTALQGGRGIVLAAVAQDAAAVQCAAREPQEDSDFVLAAVAPDAAALQYAAPELRGISDFVLAAVAQDAAALQQEAPEIRGGSNFASPAMAQDASTLQYADPGIREDRDQRILLTAGSVQAINRESVDSDHLQGRLPGGTQHRFPAADCAPPVTGDTAQVREHVLTLLDVCNEALTSSWSHLHRMQDNFPSQAAGTALRSAVGDRMVTFVWPDGAARRDDGHAISSDRIEICSDHYYPSSPITLYHRRHQPSPMHHQHHHLHHDGGGAGTLNDLGPLHVGAFFKGGGGGQNSPH